MKVDEHAESNIKKEINTICQTAITVWNTVAEEGTELIEKLDKVVESLVTTYELKPEVLTKYRSTVESAREMRLGLTKKITYNEAINARDMIFALCDQLTDPKQIMEYVRTGCEIVYVWDERLER